MNAGACFHELVCGNWTSRAVKDYSCDEANASLLSLMFVLESLSMSYLKRARSDIFDGIHKMSLFARLDFITFKFRRFFRMISLGFLVVVF